MKKTLSFFLILVLVFCSFSALTLQTEAYYGNNSFGNAATININQSYTSNIINSSDEDWFKFTLTTAGKINIDFSHTYVNTSNKKWSLKLYDSNKNLITGPWSYEGETTKTETTENIGLPAGTYYIVVIPYDSYYISTVDYCIKVNFTASSVWEKEFNDDYYTSSNPISLNKKYYGTIMDSGDVDWFKFTLTTAGKINIDFSHTYVNTSNKKWSLKLYDSNKNLITGPWSYKGETTKTETTENIGLPAGTYYIVVIPYDSYYISTVDYCIKVNFTASSVWEKEFNNDYYTSSTPISLNKKYYGTIMDSGDVDWFKFTLNSKKKICVSFSHTYVNTSNSKWSLKLYDSDKNQIDWWSYKGNETGSKKTQYITLPKGTYYIVVIPYDSYYISTVDYCLMVSDYVATPKLTSISNGSGKVTVKWDKVSGAKGYYVYRKTYSNGKWSGWSKVTTTTNNYYNDTNISSGKYYKYTVRAYIGETVSGYNTTGLQTKYLAVTPLKSAVSQKDGIKVTWGKVAGAKGYNVYRQTYSNGKWSGWTKIKTISSGSTVSYTDKSAKKGVTYKYTVRATSDSYMGYYNTKGLQVKDKY